MIKDIIIKGDAGSIEGRYYDACIKSAPIALVMHPHPLHGGTMNNKVSYYLFDSFVKCGFSVVRFNFRGVGKSQGVFDHGVGELLDAATVLDWLQNNNAEFSSCWLAGFSFGSWIALQLLMRRPEVDGFVVAAPPVDSYDFSFLSPCPSKGLIVQGSEDKISSEESVLNFHDKLDKQRNSDIECVSISGADHFFKNKIDDFKSVVHEYIENNTGTSGYSNLNLR